MSEQNTHGMSEYNYRTWCQAVETLMSMVVEQRLRAGGEPTPRCFLDNLDRYSRMMRALLTESADKKAN